MGHAGPTALFGQPIVDPDYPAVNGKRIWIDREDYSRLIERLRPQVDPPSLVVTGVLTRDGHFSPSAWDYLPEATSSDSEPLPVGAHYSVRVLNRSGAVIAEVMRPAVFELIVEEREAEVEASVIPVAVTVAYPADGERLQVTLDGVVKHEEAISPKLLTDAVRALPNGSFVKNADQMRNALLNKVAAFAGMIERRQTLAARNKLINDVRKSVTAWLLDEFVSDDLLSTTKARLLNLIDAEEERLR